MGVALVRLFSSVRHNVTFKLFCCGSFMAALVAVVSLLSTVREQMSFKICHISDRNASSLQCESKCEISDLPTDRIYLVQKKKKTNTNTKRFGSKIKPNMNSNIFGSTIKPNTNTNLFGPKIRTEYKYESIWFKNKEKNKCEFEYNWFKNKNQSQIQTYSVQK